MIRLTILTILSNKTLGTIKFKLSKEGGDDRWGEFVFGVFIIYFISFARKIMVYILHIKTQGFNWNYLPQMKNRL